MHALIVVSLLFIDLLAVSISFLVAFYLRRVLGEQGILFEPLARDLRFYLDYWPILAVWPAVLWREGLYPGLWMTADEELRRTVQGTSLASLLVIMLTFVTKTGPEFSRPILMGWWAASLVLLPLHRLGVKFMLSFLPLAGWPAVIIGTNPMAERIIHALQRQSLPAFHPVAVFDRKTDVPLRFFAGVPVEGPEDQAPDWAAEHGVDMAVVIRPDLSGDDLVTLTERLSTAFRRVLVIPDVYGLSTVNTSVRDMEGVLALEIRRNLLSRPSQVAKRLLDLVLVGALGTIFLPLGLLIGMPLALERQGPIFFGHMRLGRNGEPFAAWKFRTMVRDADAILERALKRDPRLQEEWSRNQKLKHDPRLTRVGRMLRRLSLDELPQLWNVLKGEMSLVGPRPIVEGEVAKYGESVDLYFQVRPGLTGLWQVSGRSDLSYEERVRLDTYYVRNWSVWLDLVILLRTGLAVLSGRGAY